MRSSSGSRGRSTPGAPSSARTSSPAATRCAAAEGGGPRPPAATRCAAAEGGGSAGLRRLDGAAAHERADPADRGPYRGGVAELLAGQRAQLVGQRRERAAGRGIVAVLVAVQDPLDLDLERARDAARQRAEGGDELAGELLGGRLRLRRRGVAGVAAAVAVAVGLLGVRRLRAIVAVVADAVAVAVRPLGGVAREAVLAV